MQMIRLRLASLSAVAVLAACSGGTTNPGINGLAATGAALANASVTVKCASGTPLIGTTGVDGNYSIDLGLGQNAPCMVQVTNGTVTLYSFASAAGRVNITPLTDLVVTKALGSDPASAFASYSSATGNTITAGMSAAKAYVSAQITTLIGGTQSGDPITGVFKVGDANDKVLDDLAAKLLTDGKSQGDLHQAAITGGTLVTSLNRGTLVASPAGPFFTFTKAQFDGSPLFAITGPAVCDVKVVPLNYNTVGVSGEAANASGVMLVPTGSGLGCSSPAALVAYAKGTDVQKPRTLANPADGETFLLAATYAAKGYVVVATDYLGFAQSTYAYHPYLHADSEASSVIDSIRAARKAATSVGATLSGKVMVTGYSQGGHASMAAHRAIERDNASEINLVAGAHLAGPYNMSGSLKVPAAIAGVQFFVPYLVTAWQKVYGNIYSSVATAFKAPYASYIETLLPHPTLTYGTLPYDTTTTPPTLWLPGALSETPDQARDAMFQAAFITDIQTNNSSPLYVAAKKNDLLGWNPKSKLLLCGGSGDPTVSPAVHQNVMKADFDSRGLTNVSSVDVDATVQYFYGDIMTNNPAEYYGDYHGTYEPPFCHAAAVAVFNTVK